MPASNIIGVYIAALLILLLAIPAHFLGYAVTLPELMAAGTALGGAVGHVIDLKWPNIDRPKPILPMQPPV